MIAALHPGTLAVLWLGAFVGGLATAATGFGFALASSALWLHWLTPVQTTIVATGCGAVLQMATIWRLRHVVDLCRLWPFLLGCSLGVPAGLALLGSVDMHVLKVWLGVLLMIFGGYYLVTSRPKPLAAGGRLADLVVGFSGGVLGGLAGYSGVLPVMWTQFRGWPRDIARAVYQPFVFFAQVMALVLISFFGGNFGIDATSMGMAVFVFPALAFGSVGWLAPVWTLQRATIPKVGRGICRDIRINARTLKKDDGDACRDG